MTTHTKRQPTFIALAAAAVSLLSACAQEFDPPSLIARTRVLGAVVQVDGDESRATPGPGESATVTWIVAAPGELPALGWAFVVCPAGKAPDRPACTPAPLLVAQGEGTPQFRLTVPASDALGEIDRLTVLGQICDDGVPVFDPQTGVAACTGAGTTATIDIHVQLGADANHNPDLAARPFGIDGNDWPADDGGLGCPGVPAVAAGSKDHVLRLATLAEDRETIVTPAVDPAAAGNTSREMLQISSFDTAGKLGQTYAFVAADDASPESDVDIKWDAPDVAPPDGLVHFVFVARDLRGGVGFATRTVCVQ